MNIGGIGTNNNAGGNTQPGAGSAPLYFSATDPLAGGSIDSLTITVFNNQHQQMDSITTINGAASTNTFWRPGQTGFVQISKPGYIDQTINFVVPANPSVVAGGAQQYVIPLTTSQLGTFVIRCSDNFGNTYNTGDTISYSALGSSSVTLSFTIFNSATNTGYVTTYDTLNGVNQAAGITMSTTGSDLSFPSGISGLSNPQTFPRGTSTFWSATVPDQGLTNQRVGSTLVSQGQQPFSVTVNQAALTSGSQTINLNLIAPFDSTHFASNGIGGPNSQTLSTFSLTFAP